MNKNLPVVVLVAASVLWGLTWWPLKFFNQQGVEGVPLILVAYGSVGLVLLPVIWRQRGAWLVQPGFMLLVLVLGGYANLAFAGAMIHGDVVRVMVLFYLTPIWGVLGGRVFLQETIDGQRWLGVALALGGAFLILGGPHILDTPPSWIDLLAISAGFAFAMNNITFRATPRLPVWPKVAAMFLGCLLLAGALLLLQGERMLSVATSTWSWLLIFGLGWLLVATLGTQWGVTHMEAGRASIIIILELVAAVVSATLIGRETMSLQEMIGGALILAAAVIEARRDADTGVPASETV